MIILEVEGGAKQQSADERLAYSITTTNWASTPTSPVVVVYDVTTGYTDVTTTVFPVNSPTAAGDVISLSLLRALTKGHTYRIEVQFTVGSNVWECYFLVECVI